MEPVHSPLRLHRLPPPLLLLIAQYLPLPEKLLQLSRLCRLYPPLSPLCFAFDTVAWTPGLISRLTASPTPPLLSLLQPVPLALFVDEPGPPLAGLCHLLSPSASTPRSPFPDLRAVRLAFPRLGSHGDLPLLTADLSPVVGLSHCPHLTALHLSLFSSVDVDLSPFLSPLLRFAALRALTVNANLPSHHLLLLLSLPLHSLDLLSSVIFLSAPPPLPFPPATSLRTFLLPSLLDERLTAPLLSAQWQRAMLSPLISLDEVGRKPALERLAVPRIDVSNLPYIPLLHRLQTLQLSVPHEEEDNGAEVLDLYSVLTSSPLPLRHLQLHHAALGAYRVLPWSAALFTALPPLVCAYAGQLLSLVLLHSFRYSDVVDPLPGVEIAQAMTSALLQCRSLRRLRVTDWWLSSSAPASAWPSPVFPHLEALQLDVVKGVDEATLAVLLDASPHLQELRFNTACIVPYDILPWIGDRCHQLRTLVVTHMRNDLLASSYSPPAPERWSSPSSAVPALPLLSVLIFSAEPISRTQRSLSFSRLTRYLVHSTPSLRTLFITNHDWLEGERILLSALGQLTQLRALSLGYEDWMQRGQLASYWLDSTMRWKKGSRVLRPTRGREESDDVWGAEEQPRPSWHWRYEDEELRMRGRAMREEEVGAQWEGNVPSFKQEMEDGIAGARAFFAAIVDDSNSLPAVS